MRPLLLSILLASALTACAGEPARPARPMFKGVELYSWRDAPGQPWKFVLSPGTNRRKTPGEVLASPEVLQSRAELEARLALLAAGEEVFWLVMDADGFALPARDERDAIIRYAAFRGIRVHVPHR